MHCQTYSVKTVCEDVTPSPTFAADCDVYAEFGGFTGDNVILNGKWMWYNVLNAYNMTYSRGAGRSFEYHLKQGQSADGMTVWGVYEQKDGQDDGDYKTYCDQSDIADCAGHWRLYKRYLWISTFCSCSHLRTATCCTISLSDCIPQQLFWSVARR